MGQHPFNDALDLADGLPSAKDHFGKSLPEGAMVVDAGKPHVLKGQMFQFLQTIVNGQRAFFDAGKNFFDVFFRHGAYFGLLLQYRVQTRLSSTERRPFWRFFRKLVQYLFPTCQALMELV